MSRNAVVWHSSGTSATRTLAFSVLSRTSREYAKKRHETNQFFSERALSFRDLAFSSLGISKQLPDEDDQTDSVLLLDGCQLLAAT